MSIRPISKDYLLRQFQNFNSDILENKYLRQSENFSSFRGTFNTWADVPTNSNLYKEDFRNETTPKTGDYIIVNQSKGYGTEMITVSTTTHNALGKYLADDILTYTEGTLITSDIETALSGVMVEIYIYYGISKFVYYGDFEVDGKGSYATILGWKPTVFNVEDIPFTQQQLNNLNMDYTPPTSSNISYDNTNSGLISTNIQSAVDEMSQKFQDGCTTIMNAVTDKGETPTSNSPSDIVSAIEKLRPVKVIKPKVTNFHVGYVNGSSWTWEKYNTLNCIDIYEVEEGRHYTLFVGEEAGTRFRAITIPYYEYSESGVPLKSYDITQYQGIDNEYSPDPKPVFTGTQIVNLANALGKNGNPPTIQVLPFISKSFTANTDGYLYVTKDNNGNSFVQTFLGISEEYRLPPR